MYGMPALILSSLPLATLASSHGAHTRRHRNIHVPRANNFQVTDMYKGQDFLDTAKWNFFTGADPTNGMVNYLNQQDATSKGLAFVQQDNTTVLAVDSTTSLTSGANRDSVRISSNKLYSGGLFVADFAAMPTGCATWPAWWSAGPDWPNAGEIDIVEGVNGQGTNQMTLHSNAGCTLDGNSPNANDGVSTLFTGHLLGTQCASSDGNNAGCGIADTNTSSFAAGFNNASGGVFAHLWDGSGISIWRFSRDEIPQDLTEGNPNPSTWPTPAGFWSSSTCDIGSHFYSHALTIDITLCGGWAGDAYANSGCPGTCADAVADPNNFSAAKWIINYIAVYNGVVSDS